MTLALSNDELEAALALNRRQDQAIYNPSLRADSLVEHLVAIARLAPHGSPIREHAVKGLLLLRKVRDDNRAERECIERAPLPPELPEPVRFERPPSRGIKAAVARLRGPLGNLSNPIIQGELREVASAEVAAVIAEFPEKTLRNINVRHDLGVNNFTLLMRLLDEAKRHA